MNWIDISTPIENGMTHWPGDPEVRVEPVSSIANGDEYNVTALAMCAHTGTHVDAPLHVFEDAGSVDQIPLDGLMGPAVVLDGTELTGAEGAKSLLFKCGELTLETAEEIVKHNPKMVGIASMSIGSVEVHRTLLAAGIWIVEGLDLTGITSGRYYFLCLPLKLAGAEGAPARALLREMTPSEQVQLTGANS
ncbi:MAG: cyclase family protein [Bryobacterales bacterium]|nr:cyclase family protein [Bryobacterales bacterium]